MKLSPEIIRENILQEWVSGEASLIVTLTRLRIHDKIPRSKCCMVTATASTGWEGEVWLEPPKHMEPLDALEKRLYH